MDAKDVATLLQALSVTVAALSAIYSINAWRRQLLGGKRADIAEKTLTAFYEARDIIQAARSPLGHGGEGQTRPRDPRETEEQSRYRDGLYAPAERLERDREFFMALNASRYRFAAYFGHDASAPFTTIFQVRNRVLLSTRMLVMTPDREDRTQEMIEQRWKWEQDIWGVGDKDDVIAPELNRAITQIEGTCRPVLEETNGRLAKWARGARSALRKLRRE
jgi:hypothetical protein